MSLSFVSIPAILQAPAPLAARQWHKLYDIGKSLALPLTAAATLSTAFVAYHRTFSHALKYTRTHLAYHSFVNL